jgi:GNAT superfamily N-acetyltransferase
MDMLVPLYKIDDAANGQRAVAEQGITIRRAMPYERESIIKWVRQTFPSDGHGWAGECEVSLSCVPATCHIATRDGELLGFACYDATAKGMFGPTGLHDNVRGNGLGSALLIASLSAMREAGYAYAVIGGVGEHVREFYEKAVAATVIDGSEPGIYVDMIRPVT